jgi:predicted ATPase
VIVTPDQRVRVFVSSTLEELADERAAARGAIERLRLIPVMFELGARPHPPAEVYRSYLEQSDVFVGIYGEAYGWVAPGAHVSGVEDELRRSAEKPRLLYVKQPAPRRDERLASLIRQIEVDAAVSYRVFADAAELGRLLADDLAVLLSERFQASPRASPVAATLPAPVDRFVGRETELRQLEQHLLDGSVRLVTVTGPGGVGKTRLALEAALRAGQAFGAGAHLVPLESVSDHSLVASAIASSLGLRGSARAPLDDVVDALGEADLLLFLDNFEHVLPAAPVVAALLGECSMLTLLVTSRAVLRLRGEREFAVSPLTLPGASADAGEIGEAEAVALFVERARAARPEFALDAGNREAVAAICRTLDGLPLAIELAAARLRALSPQAVLTRLEDRLDLATRAAHAYPDRQRTLRAAIEWSYALLDVHEKALVGQLGVFRGGWTLDAAAAVCGPPSVETLESLVEKSLVVADGGAEPRFSMLPTIHDYAVERLAASPDADDVRRRHAEFFRAVAAGANLEAARIATDAGGRLISGDIRLDVVLTEQDNLRAALAWSLESGSPALGLELATSLEGFWITGDPAEGMHWFAAMLALPAAAAVAPEVRARALLAYGSAAHLSGDVELARRLYGESLSLFDALGHARGRAVLLYRLGITAMQRGDVGLAGRLVEESRGIQVGEGDRWGEVQSIGALGAIARERGDAAAAEKLLEESVALAREIDARWWESGMLAELAALALDAGRLDEAEARAREALSIAEEIRDRAGRVFGVGLLAAVDAARGRAARAWQLWSAVEDEAATSPLGGWSRHRESCAARIVGTGEPSRREFAGRPLRLDEAVSLALERRA